MLVLVQDQVGQQIWVVQKGVVYGCVVVYDDVVVVVGVGMFVVDYEFVCIKV